MSLLKLRQAVCAAEENFYEIDSEEPRDELGNRRRERAFREMSRARRALAIYQQIRRICLQNKLTCQMADHIWSFA